MFKKQRGDNELSALRRVQCDICGEKTLSESLFASEEDPRFSLNLREDRFFGFSGEELMDAARLIFTAKPNCEPNSFPDFIGPYGLIEHFQISGTGKRGKGGYHRSHGDFVKRHSKELESIRLSEGESRLGSIATGNELPLATHEGVLASLEYSWKHHAERCEGFQLDGLCGKRVFLVEMAQHGLEMFEHINVSGIKGRKFGDLYRPEHISSYRLSRDKDALKWIYNYPSGVDYVIFLGADGRVEVINIATIPIMLKLMPWDYCIMGGCCVGIFHSAYVKCGKPSG